MSDARATLPALLELVRDGEEVTLTRHGEPVAVLVRPDALRVRRSEAAFAVADGLHELLEESRHSTLPGPAIPPDRAEELIEQLRADRAWD